MNQNFNVNLQIDKVKSFDCSKTVTVRGRPQSKIYHEEHPDSEAEVAIMNLFTSLNGMLESSETNSCYHNPEVIQVESTHLNQLGSRFKTELCRAFEETGSCKYSDKCQFAHGYEELRNLLRHPKYKTERCRTFHSIGLCPYGARCHFVHSSIEALAHNHQVFAYHELLGSQQKKTMPDIETSSIGLKLPEMMQDINQTSLSPSFSSKFGTRLPVFKQISTPENKLLKW